MKGYNSKRITVVKRQGKGGFMMEPLQQGEDCIIGKDVQFGKNVRLRHRVIIEDDVKIGDDVYIDSNTIVRGG